MTGQGKYPKELRERAVRMVLRQQDKHPSQWSAITSIATKFGVSREALRKWVRRAEIDGGIRPGLTTDEPEQLKTLERENRELRRANEILLTDLTAVELAERSGSTVEDVRRLIELGIVSVGGSDRPFSVSDIQRVRLAGELNRSGIPLEAIATAVASGHLSFNFVGAIFPEPPAVGAKTLRQVASDLGLPLEIVTRLYEMWGIARPEPDDAIREDDAAVFAEWAASLPPESLTRNLFVHGARLVGETAHRIADFAYDFFREHVDASMLASETTLQQVMGATGAFSHAATASLRHQLSWLVQRHLERQTTQLVIEHVEAAIEAAGGAPARTASSPAIAFLDLTGYTALTEELGDVAAADHATLFASTVQEIAHAGGGQVVKLLGDGAMFWFANPGAAVLSGLELVERIDGSGLPPARVGIAAGPVVFREGDCFGRTVNVAARVMDRARPRQVLATPEVVAASDRTAVRFEDLGAVTLRGVSDPVSLAIASRAR